MKKKLLIDMHSLRASRLGMASDIPRMDGIISEKPNTNGRKTIRELAMFRYSCRKCEDAPCVMACPAEALEKDADGMIQRSTNLCVACKSCVVICPFGTIMNDFFEHIRTPGRYPDLSDPDDLVMHVQENPGHGLRLIDIEVETSADMHEMSDQIHVKENTWETHKKPEK